MSKGRSLSRLVRIRMAETGEKYTTALRAIEADPDEKARLVAVEIAQRVARREARQAAGGEETT